ncbi:MAG: hypothetical protein ACTS4U_00065 [Candidatus Hodgkinia cicadicola]
MSLSPPYFRVLSILFLSWEREGEAKGKSLSKAEISVTIIFLAKPSRCQTKS